MGFNRKDGFYHRAKREGKRSRAAYKLEELHRRYRLFTPSARILELGAAPGGWTEFIAGIVGRRGLVVGLDLLPMAGLPTPPCRLLQADITATDSPERIREIAPHPFDGVVSDMAPNLTGIRTTDEARALEVDRAALALARTVLRPGGFFLIKVFQSPDLAAFKDELCARFDGLTATRPEASRKSSAELYLLARGFQPDAQD
ncbi:MAG: RlmE family RNA methyltransferase [Deltaproteobacteria bacterium]|nr:RlmE family RNA methyltransferase [Candidatus Anaeroferrophillacea bacterium]